MTFLGWFLTIALACVCNFTEFIDIWYSKNAEEKFLKNYETENFILKTVEENTESICANKLNTLRNVIPKYIGNKEKIEIVTNPHNQLNLIIESCRLCLMSILNFTDKRFHSNDITISLLYKFKNGSNWEVVSNSDMSFTHLLNSKNSTFRYIIDNNKMSKFFNKKEDGILEEHYEPTTRDNDCKDNGKPMGSIICRHIVVENNQGSLIEAVIGISSYGKCFVPNDDIVEKQNFLSNVEHYIFEGFENRIMFVIAKRFKIIKTHLSSCGVNVEDITINNPRQRSLTWFIDQVRLLLVSCSIPVMTSTTAAA